MIVIIIIIDDVEGFEEQFSRALKKQTSYNIRSKT